MEKIESGWFSVMRADGTVTGAIALHCEKCSLTYIFLRDAGPFTVKHCNKTETYDPQRKPKGLKERIFGIESLPKRVVYRPVEPVLTHLADDWDGITRPVEDSEAAVTVASK